jgi:6-phosphogluconolactonase
VLTVYDDSELLSRAAAQLFADRARLAVQQKGRCVALLSGGTTPRRMYQLLAQAPLVHQVPWRELQLFWGDERYLPQDDPQSNFGMARAALLGRVPLQPEQLHPVPFASSPWESALCYEQELRAFFAPGPPHFDLTLLGLGANGHTAGLFPRSAPLGEHERWSCELYLPQEDRFRVTLTAPVLNRTDLVMFLVAGEGKAAALAQVLEGEYRPEELPAQLIDPHHGELIWLVDRLAAGKLTRHGSVCRRREERGALYDV